MIQHHLGSYLWITGKASSEVHIIITKFFLKTTMPAQMFSFKISVEELVAQILMERTVTYTDQQLLKYALLAENALDEKERALIDRVFYGMRHGLLKTVD